MRNEYADFPASPVLPVFRVALLASEDTREALYGLLGCHLHLLRRATLVAPQATAILCEARFCLSISWINRGPSGGVSHVAELVAEKSLDAVIFLRDSDNTAFNGPGGDRRGVATAAKSPWQPTPPPLTPCFPIWSTPHAAPDCPWFNLTTEQYMGCAPTRMSCKRRTDCRRTRAV